ncbi:MAG: polysaccharide biosynthesis protein [Acidobacteria bacterium]|nr:polysaccharide biosynthesis protein [Acidobacteriota bacterium]
MAVVQAGAQLAILLDKSLPDLRQLRTELSALPACTDCISVPGDICDPCLLNDLFGRYRPEIVFHAAALKHVPLLESDPLAAIRTNTLGTYRIAEAAVRHGVARMVFISTDKAVFPVSILGASKRLAELVMLAFNTSKTRMNCVRFGNVLGSQGSVVPLFKEQICRKGPVTVTHPDVNRYFLTGEEAVLLVLAAASFDEGGWILVPRLGDPIKIVELARYLICKAGFVPGKDIDIVFTQLRPGDKMAEELISPFETREPDIAGLLDRVATPRVPREKLGLWVAELHECLESNDAEALIGHVCRMVPEYRPSPEILTFLKLGRTQANSI